jgi:hypothetical protein
MFLSTMVVAYIKARCRQTADKGHQALASSHDKLSNAFSLHARLLSVTRAQKPLGTRGTLLERTVALSYTCTKGAI